MATPPNPLKSTACLISVTVLKEATEGRPDKDPLSRLVNYQRYERRVTGKGSVGAR